MKSIEALRCFIATVKQGSFSAAAEQLDISVSSASRQVQLLEKEFGLPLLIRHTRRLSLTEVGKTVFEQGIDICEQIDHLVEDVSYQSSHVKGLVKVSAPLWYGINYIAPLLPSLRDTWPDLRIYLNYGDENEDPFGAEYDLYFRMNDEKDSSLIARLLQPIEYWLCASPAYLHKKTKVKIPQDLYQHQLLAQDFRHKSNTWFVRSKEDELLASIDLSSAWLCSNSSPVLLQALLNSGGIGALPHRMVDQYIKEGKLIRLLPQYDVSPFKESNRMVLAYTKDKVVEQKVRVVSQFLLSKLSK